MIKCEKCKKLNDDGNGFCTYCGEKLPDIDVTENNSEKESGFTRSFNGYYISAFICFILGVIAFFISINSDNGRSIYDRTVFDVNNTASGIFYLASGIFMANILVFLGNHRKR